MTPDDLNGFLARIAERLGADQVFVESGRAARIEAGLPRSDVGFKAVMRSHLESAPEGEVLSTRGDHGQQCLAALIPQRDASTQDRAMMCAVWETSDRVVGGAARLAAFSSAVRDVAFVAGLHAELAARAAAHTEALCALDRAPVAMVAFDGRGMVRHLNTVARRMAEAGALAVVVGGAVELPSGEATADVRAAIRLLIDRDQPSFLSLVMENQSLLHAYVRPLPENAPSALGPFASGGHRGWRGVLCLLNGASFIEAAGDTLSHRLSLTRAELRLATMLAAGQSMVAASEKLGIAYETARTQLRSVFAKLNIRRQQDLVAVFEAAALDGVTS